MKSALEAELHVGEGDPLLAGCTGGRVRVRRGRQVPQNVRYAPKSGGAPVAYRSRSARSS
ncbi:hypothetical protein ACFPRL_17345 [Pseudoclavibacter helvolus]